ncbi:MAG: BamA/TamA family outer membrane protein [Flavobacteriales bacterium]|nr:BamA/TamA family outer membrane protein [Flavobacteriales bacterium]
MFRVSLSLLATCSLLVWNGAAAQGTTGPAPAVKVYGITLSGNTTTKDRIILRELVIKEGDSLPSAALYERMERSRQNLMNTGLFNTVTVMPLYLDQRSVMVEVTVNERWYIWPAIIFDLADPNFNTWWLTKDFDRVNYGLYLYKYNMRGRNETAYIKAQFGYTKQFAFRYKVPNLDARQRWGVSVGGSFDEQAEVTAGTADNVRILLRDRDGSNRERWKADVEATLRRTHDIRHSWRLSFTQADVRDTVTRTAIDYFDGPSTHTRYLTLGYSFVRDRRDSRAFTRAGQYQEVKLDRYGLGLLDRSAPDITTAYATTKHWFQLKPKWTLGLSARGKYTFGTPPYYVQEGLGYGHFVRGYEYYVIDGEHFALGKANLIFQLVKPRTYRMEGVPLEAFRTLYIAIYLNLYSDLGRVWDSRYASMNPLSDHWINGNGLGLDLVTSYDQVLRAEYSINALGEHGFFLHFTQPF